LFVLSAGALIDIVMENVQLKELQPKKTPIRDDYNLSREELGDGVNGKVLACHSRADGRKCALKVTLFSCRYTCEVRSKYPGSVVHRLVPVTKLFTLLCLCFQAV